jgi:CHC2 zinc finger
VHCVSARTAVYEAAEIVADLPEPPRKPPASIQLTRPARHSPDPLLSFPATEYVPALTGRELGRNLKMNCPFHDDRTPSLHCYPGDRGWKCFGCGRGGSIIDLGAELYDLQPRGAGFHEIRRRLASDLLERAA